MPPTTEEVRPSYLTMQSPSPATATSVVVHPLVLLSVTDHASRMAIRARKRVVGVLLGQDMGKTINVANSFAVPFEEDENDPKTLFLDHDYIYGMLEMFKKVNGMHDGTDSSARAFCWMVPHGAEAALVGPGDQPHDEAVHAASRDGDY